MVLFRRKCKRKRENSSHQRWPQREYVRSVSVLVRSEMQLVEGWYFGAVDTSFSRRPKYVCECNIICYCIILAYCRIVKCGIMPWNLFIWLLNRKQSLVLTSIRWCVDSWWRWCVWHDASSSDYLSPCDQIQLSNHLPATRRRERKESTERKKHLMHLLKELDTSSRSDLIIFQWIDIISIEQEKNVSFFKLWFDVENPTTESKCFNGF